MGRLDHIMGSKSVPYWVTVGHREEWEHNEAKHVGSYINLLPLRDRSPPPERERTGTPLFRLYGARRGDDDPRLGTPRVRANGLDLLDDVHAVFGLAEHDVLAVQP